MEIARGLSDVQRYWLARAQRDDGWFPASAPIQTERALERRGLVAKGRLTDLGAQVDEYIAGR